MTAAFRVGVPFGTSMASRRERVQTSITIAVVLSSASFLLYGASLFGSRAMEAEFERYQLAPYRALTGALEMADGAGLLAGLRLRPLLLLSAGGLALMMLGAIVVRLRVRDPLLSVIPALLLPVTASATHELLRLRVPPGGPSTAPALTRERHSCSLAGGLSLGPVRPARTKESLPRRRPTTSPVPIRRCEGARPYSRR